MDRTKYLPKEYSEEDKKLIAFFQKEIRRLDMLYVRAINSNNSEKAMELMKKIREVSKSLKNEYSERADLVIPREYLKGTKYIDDTLRWDTTLSVIIQANKKEVAWMIKELWPLHMEAVNWLLNTSKNYVKSSLDWMERQAITMIWELQQEKVREQLAWGILSWDSLLKVEARVKKYFLNNKITWFKDRAWRIRDMDRYVDMLTRTETKIANVQGTINRAVQLWITKFKIVENIDCCEECEEYNWEIVDVANWTVDLPPYHPNCRGYIIAEV